MVHELPDDVPVNTIKSLPEVNKIQVQWSLPFLRLSDDYPLSGNMVGV